jgi:hypothetical protein
MSECLYRLIFILELINLSLDEIYPTIFAFKHFSVVWLLTSLV